MVLVGPGCKLLRCEPLEARMGPVVIIVVTPSCNDLMVMAVTPEQMLVQTFVSQPTVK